MVGSDPGSDPTIVVRFGAVVANQERRLRRVSLRMRARMALLGDLGATGERVDIDLSRGHVDLPRLGLFERCHLARYEFAAALLPPGSAVGDLACGTAYGSALLARTAGRVLGVDDVPRVVARARSRYGHVANVEFVCADLRRLDLAGELDAVISFETLEHFAEPDLLEVLRVFQRALRPRGLLVLSTPYRQPETPLGFHETFAIDEPRLAAWLGATGFRALDLAWQDHDSCVVSPALPRPEYVVCVAERT